jgi:cyclophilin family peptidyl-prolyl cis-trans isomerase
VADPTDETTEELDAPRTTRATRTRRAPRVEAERDTPRPDLDVEPEPEPIVKPGSLSRTLGHVALTALALAVLYTAWQHTRREPSDEGERGIDDPTGVQEDEPGNPDEPQEVTTTLAEPGPPVDPECPPEGGAGQPVRAFDGPPPTCIDLGQTYVATVDTNRGTFEITLDTAAAPQTVNNFVFLARWGYYDGASFYRVVPELSIGTGDPIGQDGTGDPGYTIPDELPTEAPFYPELSVRMTNRGEPNTNESEFSIVTGRAAESGPPRYSRFGRITEGQEVVRAIEATGDPGSDTGMPLETTVIEGITISER